MTVHLKAGFCYFKSKCKHISKHKVLSKQKIQPTLKQGHKHRPWWDVRSQAGIVPAVTWSYPHGILQDEYIHPQSPDGETRVQRSQVPSSRPCGQ